MLTTGSVKNAIPVRKRIWEIRKVFWDSGKMIKGLAIISCILQSIGAFITGLVLTIDYDGDEFWTYLIMFLGPVVVWIVHLLLYGYGELIDKTCEIAENVRRDETESETTVKKSKKKFEILKRENEKKNNNEAAKKIEKEPEPEPLEYVDVECPRCSRQLSFEKGTKEFLCPYCECSFKEIE